MSNSIINSLKSGIKVNGWNMITDSFSDSLIRTIVSDKPGFFKGLIDKFLGSGFKQDDRLIKVIAEGLTDEQKFNCGLVFNYRSGKRKTYVKDTPIGQAMLIHDLIPVADWNSVPEDKYKPLDLKTHAERVNKTIDELREQCKEPFFYEIITLRLPPNLPLNWVEQYLLQHNNA